MRTKPLSKAMYVRPTQAQKEKLEQLSRQSGRPMSDIVREALNVYFRVKEIQINGENSDE